MAIRLTCAVMLVAALSATSHAQTPRARAREAVVSVALRQDGRAEVHGSYMFVGNPGAMSFEWLDRPCATVEDVRLESQGRAVPYARVVTGPWVRLHDTSAVDPARDSLGYDFAYEVALQGRDVAIPVLLPTVTLTPRRAAPIAELAVHLLVDGRVTLPAMRRRSDGAWTTTLVAMPSAVHVRLDRPNERCERRIARQSGSFVLIFWSLVATLALWVPLYLWWANRERAT